MRRLRPCGSRPARASRLRWTGVPPGCGWARSGCGCMSSRWFWATAVASSPAGTSRRVWISLLDGHSQAFEHFGGRTETILYDNPRTIVLAKDESSGWVKWNAKFKDRMDFYGVTLRLCRYYRAQTKGKVESGVKYVKRNALVGRRFGDLTELNAWLLQWSLEVADQRVHGTTHELPAQRFARAEAAALTAVDARPPAPQERIENRIVPRDGLVAVEANRYPVPLSWVGRTVRVHLLAEEILSRARRRGDGAPRPSCGQTPGSPVERPAAQLAGCRRRRRQGRRGSTRSTCARAGDVEARPLALLRGGAMSSFAVEQIQEQMRQLKLVRTAEQLPLLLQDASKAEVSYSEFLAELLRARAGRQAGAAHGDEDDDGPLPVPEEPGELRLQVSALASSRRSSASWPPAATWPMRTTCCCSGLRAWARPTWRWRSACEPVPWAFGLRLSPRPG